MTRREERGVGTVLTLGVALALSVVIAAATVLIGWFAGVRHAEQVAEIAALAGASAAAAAGDPCHGARQAAAQNDMELSHCAVRGSGADVVVEAGVTVDLVPGLPGMPSRIERHATAGTM